LVSGRLLASSDSNNNNSRLIESGQSGNVNCGLKQECIKFNGNEAQAALRRTDGQTDDDGKNRAST